MMSTLKRLHSEVMYLPVASGAVELLLYLTFLSQILTLTHIATEILSQSCADRRRRRRTSIMMPASKHTNILLRLSIRLMVWKDLKLKLRANG